MVAHLLVTNDFPPKVGGIQQYLWELWRRLPSQDVTVLTTPYEGAEDFDAKHPFRVVRTKQWWLLPTRKLAQQINRLADEVHAELIVLDPAFPLGLIGPKLTRPYVLIGHGAEYVIPSRIPFVKQFVARTTRRSHGLIASGEYVSRKMRALTGARQSRLAVIPPGVDVERFKPLNDVTKQRVRERWGVPGDQLLILGVSRLVPRKGFDRLIKAAATFSDVEVLIAGTGRDTRRLLRLIERTGARAQLVGRVDNHELANLYGTADIFAMPCHDRWFGFEQEGYGIVFVEAAAAGIPSIAGMSGGSHEAVLDGETGLIVQGPARFRDVAHAIERLRDRELRERLGTQGRMRVESELSYDHLAAKLLTFLRDLSATSP